MVILLLIEQDTIVGMDSFKTLLETGDKDADYLQQFKTK